MSQSGGDLSPVTGNDAHEPSFLDACRVVVAAGFTPVNTEANRRLRAWLTKTNGWPPADWNPEDSGRRPEGS